MKLQNKNKLRIILEIVILILVIIVIFKWIFPSKILSPEKEVASIYYQVIDENTLRCHLCGMQCLLKEGERGACGQIINKQGKLYYVR